MRYTCSLLEGEDLCILDKLGMFNANSNQGGAVSSKVLSMESIQHGNLVLANLKRKKYLKFNIRERNKRLMHKQP